MESLAKHGGADLAVLDGLAKEARYYSESIATNMIQLGRVFTDAKKLVKHGEWGAWLRSNADCSERTAQQFMQVYGRFGENPAFARIGERSKLFKMLALPPGTEDDFMDRNDVAGMSSREVDAAVKVFRERAEQAEARVKELENRPPEIPEDITETLQEKNALIEKQKTELERAASTGRDGIAIANELRRANERLKRELTENVELLEETQQECNRAQAELLNMQSAFAKGDAERMPSDELTSDVFAAAVRQFIGTCARMPHMGRSFGLMHQDERQAFDELLRTVEGWAKDARRALETICGEVIDL